MLEISRTVTIPGLLVDGKLNYEKVFSNIVNTLVNYINENKLKCVVIGLSGGIDCTVCAGIWKRVCDVTGIPLIGYSLPCSSNQADEVSGAQLAGCEFCNEFHEVNLQELFEATKRTIEDEKHPQTSIADGNIKARLRMIFLYNVAGIRGGIVSSNGQIDEKFLGFYTQHGDEGNVSPIANLWKTEVYELAAWMTKNIYKDSKALNAAITITPTDGNGVKEGGDMAQIAPGKTYADVDKVLQTWCNLHPNIQKQWLENHNSFNKDWAINKLCGELGTDIVEGIIDRHIRTAFKRRKHPLDVNCFMGCVEG